MVQNTTFHQARTVSIVGLMLILIATLYPFRFNFNHQLQTGIANFFSYEGMWGDNWKEPLANILLFIPLGFGVTGLMSQQARPFIIFITTFGTGIALSVIVEFLQLLVLVRTTTIFDVFTNGLGAASGYILFSLYGVRLFRMTNVYFNRIFKKILLPLIMTFCLTYLIIINIYWQSLYHQVSLKNWNSGFPLILGNEKSGNRSWKGTVYKLYFADFVMQEKEIDHALIQGKPLLNKMLALYQLDNIDNAYFSNQFESLSGLTKNSRELQEQKIKAFSNLEFIDKSIESLNARLKIASRFTIGAIVQTENSNQAGPARIFTISPSPRQRNIMFGQEANDLVIRLRTPITGVNGSKPDIIIPDVFADTQPHHLIVTYNGHHLRIYVDSIKQAFSFDLMEVAVAQQFFLSSYHKPVILPVNQIGYLLFKYGLFLGLPLSLLWVCRKQLWSLSNINYKAIKKT